MGNHRPALRTLVGKLRQSSDPSVRWRTAVRVMGEDRSSPTVRRIEEEVRRSRRARLLLAQHSEGVKRKAFDRPYHYWQGIHWALAALPDIGYPMDSRALDVSLDRVLDYWTQPRFLRTIRAKRATPALVNRGVLVIRGRARRCASIQGNALLTGVLGRPSDPRVRQLSNLLLRWQWPDGGWNCAKGPTAHVSSFMETLIPMRALSAYARGTGSTDAREAAQRAAEVFLQRQLYLRRRDGSVMRPEFTRIHFPSYWHYDVLAGLRGMADVGQISDARCGKALDWLEGRQRPGGGWGCDRRYYRVSTSFGSSSESVAWGPSDGRRRNDWVTTEALHVLAAAGRLEL